MSTFIYGDTFAHAYERLLEMCYSAPDYTSKPRGMEVKELISPSIRVRNPRNRFYKSNARSTPMRYCAGEFLWYFGLRNDAPFIAKYSAFWNSIKNSASTEMLEENTVNSSYGMLAMDNRWADAHWGGLSTTQWNWALRSLIRDNDSRQAIVHINRPAHQHEWVKDFPCTMHMQFFLREGRLHLVVTMRSNDLIKGLTFDFPMFSFFQEQFLSDLKARSEQEGKPIVAELGHLTLTAGSSHIYDRDYDLVKSMLEEGLKPNGDYPLQAPIVALNPHGPSPQWEIDWSPEFKALTKFAETGDEEVFAGLSLDPLYTLFKESIK